MDWRFRGGELVAFLMMPLLQAARAGADAEPILSCDVRDLEPCGDDDQQFCDETTGTCHCLAPLRMVEGRCVAEAAGGGSAIWGVLATVAALVLLLAALVLVVRRYQLLQWVRRRLQPHSPHNAYEDVMIGADDPPLTL